MKGKQIGIELYQELRQELEALKAQHDRLRIVINEWNTDRSNAIAKRKAASQELDEHDSGFYGAVEWLLEDIQDAIEIDVSQPKQE